LSGDLLPDFDWLFLQHQHKVYRLALALAGNPYDAEDITQESFLRAFRSYHSFRNESSLFTWIYRITLNVAADFIKKRPKLPVQELIQNFGLSLDEMIDPNPSHDPEMEFLSKEMMYRCLHCFTECLPAKQRTVFCLAVTLGLPYKTTAEILDLSLAAVKTTVHRARHRIAGYLEDRCQLIRESNPCHCSQWVRFALRQGWIKMERPIAPPVETVKQYKDNIDTLRKLKGIYQSLYPEMPDDAVARRIKEGIRNNEWEIFL